ncbi:MAG TPA: hypothetical protein VGI39_01575 [Polyangiaceae bacterium]|jgi:hypothetical protein
MRKLPPLLSLLGVTALGAGALGFGFGACAPAGFDSSTKIESVRILATRADGDKSYARPGDTVTLQTLVVDGRTNPTKPATLYWIPYLCQNPIDDVYAACFVPPSGTDAGAQGGDAGAGLAGILQTGVDLTPYLPTGPYTFTVPSDIIAKHPPVQGVSDPYGLVIVFNIACAGHVRWAGIDPNAGPQQIPLLCTDDSGTALSANDYVIGFTRVYVYDDRINANPEIDGIIVNGNEIRTNVAGSATPNPLALSLPANNSCDGGCDASTIDMDVPQSSWAGAAPCDSADAGDPGTSCHKEIWVDYYAQGGGIDSEARLLYDVNQGKVTPTGPAVKYYPPDDPGPGTLWAVVHDNRGGVTWLTVNVTATK